MCYISTEADRTVPSVVRLVRGLCVLNALLNLVLPFAEEYVLWFSYYFKINKLGLRFMLSYFSRRLMQMAGCIV